MQCTKDLETEVVSMRAITYLMLGIVGTMAYQRMSDNGMIPKDMKRMMRRNNTMKKIKEIF